MFTSKPGIETACRAVLITVILCNALIPTAASASALSGENQHGVDTGNIDNSFVEDITTHPDETVDQIQTVPPELRDVAGATGQR